MNKISPTLNIPIFPFLSDAHKRTGLVVPNSKDMDDLSVAVETSFWLQGVKAFQEVHGKGLPQEESVREGLERLSVWQ